MGLSPSYRVLLRSPLPLAEVTRGLHAELSSSPRIPLLLGAPLFMRNPADRGYVRGQLTDAWLHLAPGSRRISSVQLDAELQPSEYGTDVLATLSVRPKAAFGPEGTRRIALMLLVAGLLLTVFGIATGQYAVAFIGGLAILSGGCILAMLPVAVMLMKQEMSYLESWLGIRLHATRYPVQPSRPVHVR
jgi:hypothetical protein